MCGITDPFISRSTARSPTHSASGTYSPLPLRPGRFVEVTTGSWVCFKYCREKAHEGTLEFMRLFGLFKKTAFTFFYHSWMYYLYLQVVKSIVTVNDKGIYCFIQFLPCCKSPCKVAEGESERLFWSSVYQKAVCVYTCTWNKSVHMNH